MHRFGFSVGLSASNVRFSKLELPCQFRTRIDKPDQAIDKYGRFVGDIFIKVGGVDVNLNNAMLEPGENLPDEISTHRHCNPFPEQSGARLDGGDMSFNRHGPRRRPSGSSQICRKENGPGPVAAGAGPSHQPAIAAGETLRDNAASFQLAQGMSCGAMSISLVKRTSFQSPGLLPKM